MYPAKIDFPLTGLNWRQYYGGHNVYHPGIDFNSGTGNEDLGNDVVCPKPGFVEYVHVGRYHRGFGNFIIIQHEDGNYTRYAHLNDVTVRVGDSLRESDLIGHVGNTGTTYAHLHFEVIKPSMAAIQKKHWSKWRFYPSNKDKVYVTKHYLNPWRWLEESGKVTPEEWRVDVEKWASKYINDMPAFLNSYDPHKWMALIRRALKDKK